MLLMSPGLAPPPPSLWELTDRSQSLARVRWCWLERTGAAQNVSRQPCPSLHGKTRQNGSASAKTNKKCVNFNKLVLSIPLEHLAITHKRHSKSSSNHRVKPDLKLSQGLFVVITHKYAPIRTQNLHLQLYLDLKQVFKFFSKE